MNKSIKILNYLIPFLLVIVIITLQVILLKKIGKIEVIIGLNLIPLTLLFLSFYTSKIYNYLIIIYLIPLVLLNNSVHYQFKNELIFALPLLILTFYTILIYLLNPKKKKTATYLSKPTLIFVAFFLLMGLWGKLNGNASEFIAIEAFHFLLFGSIILFKYNLKTREDYLIIFSAILILFLLISFQYIYFGAIIKGARFVTFQSGFLPFIAGALFSFYLFKKNKLSKIIYIVLTLIVVLAMISTLTRSLWVTTMISLSSTYLLYLWVNNKLTFNKKVLFVIFSVVAFAMIIQKVSNTKPDKEVGENEKIEDRASSIANPTEDHSFLMRVELGWYSLQKFYEKPVIGWGLGDILRYKYLGNPKLRKVYLDNSWFYFLWKGGLIGFLLISVIFYRSIKIGLFIISKTDNMIVRTVVVSIVAGEIGLIAISFLSPLLIKYRTNVLLPLVWAYLEFEYNMIKSNNYKISNENINNNSKL